MLTPNTIFFSRKLKDQYPHIAREIEHSLMENGIKANWLDHTNDIWARDYMPLQLNENDFVHYNYYPDYLMGSLEDRASITNPIRLEQQLLIARGKMVLNLPLIMDGGNAVFTDRHIVMTQKVLFENKLSKLNNEKTIVELIYKHTGLEPLFILWDAPKWNREKKVEKYGHADWLVRYLGGSSNMVIVAVNEEITMKVSESAIDKLTEAGCYDVRRFKLEHPTSNSWAYLNYVQINNVILMPTVAEEDNDKEAEEKLAQLFRESGQNVKIVPIDCQDLIKAGGALHCISWNIHI